MAYQGVSPYLFANNLTNVQLLDDISSSFNGSTTIFNLTIDGVAFRPEAARGLFIVLGGVVQDPDTDYTVSGSQITFTTAPAAGLTFAGRNIYGLNAINNVNDGVITPAKLTTGGPSWDTSGNLTISGDLIANSLGDVVNLASIDKEITDTAVDIFVYDTSKDSDGGAWRKRTQHTSWYNETLNTATRGSRREFPAVAVIVCESDTLTIYDGDDPDLPMWIVFTTTGTVTANAIVRTSGYNISTVSMINGLLVGGVNYNGGFEINFVSDKCHRRNPSVYAFGGNVASRNGGISFITLNTTAVTVNTVVNDVAMTVLPNAPIDDATGLPVPTIAVATDGGVSVIKDDGTVINGGDTGAISKIHITEENRLYYTFTSFNQTREVSIPSYWTRSGFFGTHHLLTNSSPALPTNSGNAIKVSTGSYGTSDGFVLHSPDPVTSPDSIYNDGMVAYATTSFNTGWMHGDIKGAFLSDTDATNVTGTELVTNGTFDTDTTGWTVDGVTATVSSGEVTMVGSGDLTQLINVVSGETYVISANVISIANCTANLKINTNSTGAGGTVIENRTNAGSLSGTFVASASTMYIAIQNGSANGSSTCTWDNVSVRLADPDRSVNNKGLQVFGTVTKSAVATGAELVDYSGFSTSNYLQQPYNSSIGLDSTDSLTIMCWVKQASHNSTIQVIFGAGVMSVGQGRYLYTQSGVPYLDTFGGAANQSTTNIADNNWHQLVGIYTPSGGYMYIDGVLNATIGFNSGYIDQTGESNISIGAERDTTYPTTASIALLRVSNSVPSPEQIKKIYEDEKFLFQENAACTLYGSSDAVTALAYDDSTSILYAGTSSGRSDFQGLRRINNTTTAVTTAMSASNGLVAEQ